MYTPPPAHTLPYTIPRTHRAHTAHPTNKLTYIDIVMLPLVAEPVQNPETMEKIYNGGSMYYHKIIITYTPWCARALFCDDRV